MTRPAAVDMAHHSHLTGAFAPQRNEIDAHDLEVIGEIPAELDGEYLRNGPNPRFDPIGTFVYPLDGDGMIHRIGLSGGKASYTNRFVRTPMVLAEEAAGQALWAGLLDGYAPTAEDVGPELAGTSRDLPDINVVRHGGRLLAMAEAAQPYRLDPIGLETLGRESCDGAMLAGSTAHPKIDPLTGEMFLFNYALEAPYLTWSAVSADGSLLQKPTAIDGVDTPLMVHDMALTDTYIVVVLCPLVFDIPAAMAGGSAMDWRPEMGTRIALVPRDGSAVRWASCDAFWVWHIANAFDAGSSVEIDLVEWTSPGGLVGTPVPPASSLVRLHVDPVVGSVTRTVLFDRKVEFPRIDDRRLGSEHGSISVVGSDCLWFVDTQNGNVTAWGDGFSTLGEPVFVPGGDDDYWGTLGTDKSDFSSWFHILPAGDPSAGPVASIRLPQRVPEGLHGLWAGNDV